MRGPAHRGSPTAISAPRRCCATISLHRAPTPYIPCARAARRTLALGEPPAETGHLGRSSLPHNAASEARVGYTHGVGRDPHSFVEQSARGRYARADPSLYRKRLRIEGMLGHVVKVLKSENRNLGHQIGRPGSVSRRPYGPTTRLPYSSAASSGVEP